MSQHEREPINRLFVYGLLRPDAAPAALRSALAGAMELGPATVRGLLYDQGDYPAAVPGEGVIRGRLLDWSGAVDWGRLDAFEGCDAEPPLFRRERTRVRIGEREVEAWIYWFARDVSGREPMVGGEWKVRP